jgi:4-hydroxy-tetrahydrodipicolinate reductase
MAKRNGSDSDQAHSRHGFAQGALIAAKWLYGKKGVFSMQDVIGLEF